MNIGDIVVFKPVKFDNLFRSSGFDNKNVVEYFGGNRNSKFIIDRIMGNNTFVISIYGQENKFVMSSRNFIKISDVRNDKLNELGI